MMFIKLQTIFVHLIFTARERDPKFWKVNSVSPREPTFRRKVSEQNIHDKHAKYNARHRFVIRADYQGDNYDVRSRVWPDINDYFLGEDMSAKQSLELPKRKKPRHRFSIQPQYTVGEKKAKTKAHHSHNKKPNENKKHVKSSVKHSSVQKEPESKATKLADNKETESQEKHYTKFGITTAYSEVRENPPMLALQTANTEIPLEMDTTFNPVKQNRDNSKKGRKTKKKPSEHPSLNEKSQKENKDRSEKNNHPNMATIPDWNKITMYHSEEHQDQQKFEKDPDELKMNSKSLRQGMESSEAKTVKPLKYKKKDKDDENRSVFSGDYDEKNDKNELDNQELYKDGPGNAMSVMWPDENSEDRKHKKKIGRSRHKEERFTYMTTEDDYYSYKKKKDRYRPIARDQVNKPPDLDMSGSLFPSSIARQLLCLQERDSINSIAHVEQEIIGRTANYYDIVLWKIKDKVNYRAKFRASDNHKYEDDSMEKKIVFIVHGLSVAGWRAVPCLSKLREFEILLSYYLENLDSFDIYLIPMANPDGVSHIMNIFDNPQVWNKNESPQEDCLGVALDRNFDVGRNVSLNVSSCHPEYPGLSAFSERETMAIREVFHLYGNKIVAYFHVHSGTHSSDVFKGDAVLYPKGFTDVQNDDDRYIDLKGEIDEAIRNASFKIVSVNMDTLHNWYSRVGGTSVDYASAVYGIPYALELVMQIYYNSYDTEVTQKLALQEIWQTVIDVIFDHIYRAEVKNKEETYRKRNT